MNRKTKESGNLHESKDSMLKSQLQHKDYLITTGKCSLQTLQSLLRYYHELRRIGKKPYSLMIDEIDRIETSLNQLDKLNK